MKQILTFMLVLTMMVAPLAGAASQYHRGCGAKPYRPFSSQYHHVRSGKRLSDPIGWQDVQRVVPTGVWSDLMVGWSWVTKKVQSIISTMYCWMKSYVSWGSRIIIDSMQVPSREPKERVNTWRPGLLMAQKKHAKRIMQQTIPERKPEERAIEIATIKEPVQEDVEEDFFEPEVLEEIAALCTELEQQESDSELIESSFDADCQDDSEPIERTNEESIEEQPSEEVLEAVEWEPSIEIQEIPAVQQEPVEESPLVSNELPTDVKNSSAGKSACSVKTPTVAELQRYERRKQKKHNRRRRQKRSRVHKEPEESLQRVESSHEPDEQSSMIQNQRADEHHDMFDYINQPEVNQVSASAQPYPAYTAPPLYQQPGWYQQQPAWPIQQQSTFPMNSPYQSSQQQLNSIAMQLQSSAMAMQAQAATLMAQAQQQYMPWQQGIPVQAPQITTRDATKQEKMTAAMQAIQQVINMGNASVQRLLLVLDHEFDLLEHLLAGNTGQRVEGAFKERNILLANSNTSVVTAYDRLMELATTYGHDDEIGARMYHYCVRKSKQNKSSSLVSRSKKQFLLHMMSVLERYYEIIEKMQRALTISG